MKMKNNNLNTWCPHYSTSSFPPFSSFKNNPGYKGYTDQYLFFIDHNSNYIPDLNHHLKLFLQSLDTSKIFTVLFSVHGSDIFGTPISRVVSTSLKIHSNIDFNSFSSFVSLKIYECTNNYGFDNFGTIIIHYREWIVLDPSAQSNVNAISVLDKKLSEHLAMLKLSSNSIKNFTGANIISRTKNHPLFGIIFNHFVNPINSTVSGPSNSFTFKVVSNSPNTFLVHVLDKFNHVLFSWTDTFNSDSQSFVRVFNNLRISFSSSLVVNVEYQFSLPLLSEVPRNLAPVNTIGAIDLETCSDHDNPNHGQFVYAAAYAVHGSHKSYYLGDGSNITPNDILSNLFNDILSPKLNKNTFYIHNLGRFDGAFLIKALLESGFNVKPILKDDNCILSLIVSKAFFTTAKNKEDKLLNKKSSVVRRVTILDSLQLLPGSLAKLSANFGGKFVKSIFPHGFNFSKNLYYVGPTPDFTFYRGITLETYAGLVKTNWSFKDECLKYLELDVKSLLEVLLIYSREIFKLYNLNIINYKTQAGLALNIFLSNYYDRKSLDIRVVKGFLEKEIRDGYFGGVVKVFSNVVKDGYYYDVNSHYPAAMLNDMPTGAPIFTTNKNLNDLFGFIKAKVIAPSSSQLKRAILPVKTEEGSDLARGTFIGTWFSEELKNAVKYGYKVEVIGCYQFKRTKNVFKGYVENLYALKSSSDENPSRRQVAKLLLNSLYGRMGMNEILTKVKIVPKSQLSNIYRFENWITVADMGEYVLVRHQGLLDNDLLKLIDEEFRDHVIKGLEPKMRGVISSVPIAAAVTGYARVALTHFFNMEGNECVYTDTDSVVMTKELSPEYVGPGLGQMKLEHRIKEGIFISPKTYAIRAYTKNSDRVVEIFKAKGYGSKSLTYQVYQRLLSGESVIMLKEYFLPSISRGTVNIVERGFTIRGVLYPVSPYKALPSPTSISTKMADLSLIKYVPSNLSLVGNKPQLISRTVNNHKLSRHTREKDS